MATGNYIKDFFDFVKAIGESKSKQEEDRIIADEVVHLKRVITQQQSNKKKLKELIIRAIYVEMLGQDASFAYIKAVELCASTNIIQKRVGYLASSLCLSPTHEFRFMLVNQIQRDMNSTNHLESCAALSAVCKLVTEDMIPAVIGDVVKLVRHDMESVRKKALGALHRFYQMDKTSIVSHLENVRRGLCDKDPSVMGATLPLLQSLVQDDVQAYKDLVPSLVSILKQITEHRLPRDYDYHRIPAPWVQMNLLRILALLGKGDQASSEGMYEVVADVMKRADTGINVGYAIVYEAVKTVTTIYPNPLLLDATATAISRFIRSDSHNLKYIGIKGLAAIVKDHPRYAADHQMAVIDCLEDPDETLKKKTLDLLFRMTNAVNVEFIVEKLLSFLSASSDDHFRTDLVGQITQCAERYAPSNAWYVQTVVRVFELAGDKVKQSVAQTLMQLIAEGAAEGDSAQDDDEEGDVSSDDELRMEAVEDFLDLMSKTGPGALVLSEVPVLAQTLAWVLGEYGYLSQTHSKEEVMDKLCDLMAQTSDPQTRCHVISALMKLVAQNGSSPTRITKLANHFADSVSLDLQQRCLEFKALLLRSNTMVDILPVDASCEDIEVDENLTFLQAFVTKALTQGAAPYTPQLPDQDDDIDLHKSNLLRYTAYERPSAPPANMGIMSNLSLPQSGSGVGSGPGNGSAPGTGTGLGSPIPGQGPTPLGPALSNPPAMLSGASAQGNQLLNNRGVAQVWGKKPVLAPVTEPNPTVTPSEPYPSSPSSSSSSSSYSSYPGTGTGALSPSPASSTVGITAEVSTGPRVLTEKEKMAQALFGGGGASVGARSSVRQRRQSAATTSAAATAPTVPASVPVPAVVHAPPTPPPPAAAVAATTDFFGTSSNTAAPTPAPPISNNNNILDLLDFGADTSNSTPTSIPIPNNYNNFLPPPLPPVPALVQPSPIPSPFLDAFASLTLSISPGTGAHPLAISTTEFGQRWNQSSCSCDLKQTVTTNARTLEQLRTAMPKAYGHVESIPGSLEAIFAATTSIGSIALIHVKLFAARMSCDVTVKSTNRDICAKEIAAIATALTGFVG